MTETKEFESKFHKAMEIVEKIEERELSEAKTLQDKHEAYKASSIRFNLLTEFIKEGIL